MSICLLAYSLSVWLEIRMLSAEKRGRQSEYILNKRRYQFLKFSSADNLRKLK